MYQIVTKIIFYFQLLREIIKELTLDNNFKTLNSQDTASLKQIKITLDR